MSISQQDIFQEACFRLSLSGTDPLSKRIWMKANVCLMLSVFSVMVMLTAKTFMSVGKDVDFMVDSMISFTVNYQVSSFRILWQPQYQRITKFNLVFSTVWFKTLHNPLLQTRNRGLDSQILNFLAFGSHHQPRRSPIHAKKSFFLQEYHTRLLRTGIHKRCPLHLRSATLERKDAALHSLVAEKCPITIL